MALIDEVEAREAHDARRFYTAILGTVESPNCFVEINDDYIGVGFLDDLKREYLSYQFHELEPGRVFLSMVTHRIFEGESDTVKTGTTYFFTSDGIVTVENEEFSTGTRSETTSVADTSGNWESYPNFGEYSAVARLNRAFSD